ncbi:unnamed protein product [Darwinula stevensoni]|uniref:Uncharacterized protein n=1 Tax=Darwinula stevensoni TaxID=69355 RepID=A0A7R8XAM6_9CRUS|nr:unnamed protein product [Darwinula stevensoni]CAG0890181.1 unnamed protein product [Darwinula stevensoni]
MRTQKKRQEDELHRQQNRSERKTRHGIPDYETSLHPPECGVVYTEYGAVAAGEVLMGLAFGSAPAHAKLADLFHDEPRIFDFIARDPELKGAVIFNYYAATVAGNLAQSAVYDATPTVPDSQNPIGPSGTWSSFTQRGGSQQMTGTISSKIHPTEYALANDMERVSHATNAELYGGIDGLLLARKFPETESSFTDLSRILEAYYSDRGLGPAGDASRVFGACNRFGLVGDESLVPSTEMDLQIRAMAYALYLKTHGPYPLPPAQTVRASIDERVQSVLRLYRDFVASGVNVWKRTDNLSPASNVDIFVNLDLEGKESQEAQSGKNR